MSKTRIIKLFEADDSATVSSKKHLVADHGRLAILVKRSGHSSGNSAFTFKASVRSIDEAPADAEMIDMGLFIDNAENTNAQNLTRVKSKTLSSDTETMVFLDSNVKINWLQVTCANTTDGSATAYAVIEQNV